MANIKECIYFYVYSQDYRGDKVFNYTRGYSQSEFTINTRIGMYKEKKDGEDYKDNLFRVYLQGPVFGIRYDSNGQFLLSEYLSKELKELKESHISKGEDYRGNYSVTRIFTDLHAERHYVASALSSSYLKEKVALKFEDGYVLVPNENNPEQLLEPLDSERLFNDDLNTKFIVDHRDEFVELFRTFVYAVKNDYSMYIGIQASQYQIGCQYIENILKLFPISLANIYSFASVFTGNSEKISLFFEEEREGVEKHIRNYSRSIITQLSYDLTDGNYLESDQLKEILDLNNLVHFPKEVFNQFLYDFSYTIKNLTIDNIDDYLKLLAVFMHLYDAYSDLTVVDESLQKELVFLNENYNLIVERLNKDKEQLFKKVNLILSQCQDVDISGATIEALIEARYKYDYPELENKIYSNIVHVKNGRTTFNIKGIDLMFNVGLISDDIEQFRQVFNARFLKENLSENKGALMDYLAGSAYSDGLLKLLQSKINAEISREASHKDLLQILSIIDEGLPKDGFRNTLYVSYNESKKYSSGLSDLINFYLKYISSLSSNQINLYFDILYECLNSDDAFPLMYTQLFALKMHEQRKEYFTRMMKASTDVVTEYLLADLFRRAIALYNTLHNNNVQNSLLDDFYDLYLSHINPSLISKLDLREFADEELDLYNHLLKMGEHIANKDLQKSFLRNVDFRHQQYEAFRDSESGKSELINFRVDHIIDNFLALGDKKIMKLLRTYVKPEVVSSSFAGITISQSNPEFVEKVKEVTREYLLGDDKPENKAGFAKEVIDTFESTKLTSKMSFRDFGEMIASYLTLLVIFLGLDVAFSLVMYFLVLKSGYVFLLGAVSLLNILAMTLLFGKNMQLRMFKNPFGRTLWQSLIISILMFASLYGAITLLSMF